MPMPPQLQKAKDASMAAEKAKAEAPPTYLLGLRKTEQGYEVVSAKVSDVTVLDQAQPLQFASHGLLIAIRRLIHEA